MRNSLESDLIILISVFVYILSSAEELSLMKSMLALREQAAGVETR